MTLNLIRYLENIVNTHFKVYLRRKRKKYLDNDLKYKTIVLNTKEQYKNTTNFCFCMSNKEQLLAG